MQNAQNSSEGLEHFVHFDEELRSFFKINEELFVHFIQRGTKDFLFFFKKLLTNQLNCAIMKWEAVQTSHAT